MIRPVPVLEGVHGMRFDSHGAQCADGGEVPEDGKAGVKRV
ncbi:MAG TPA: hypothetical protein VFZ16_14720 [Hyphomicrobiaceae bacterium]|nr:hypothetical protein [Hyphomicrobiaceae bacterium]